MWDQFKLQQMIILINEHAPAGLRQTEITILYYNQLYYTTLYKLLYYTTNDYTILYCTIIYDTPLYTIYYTSKLTITY